LGCVRADQGCHKGRFWRKITVRTSADVVWKSARVRIYTADAVLPTDAGLRPRGREIKNKKNKKNLVVVAGLERENFFSVFSFWFSVFSLQSPKSPNSPNSPNSPSSAGFVGEAARRRRFFRPSSPSHSSKLYSCLGWLNSKVPKPFPPFSLRLIDVDGF
jgi:hypothetical protein